MVVNEKEVADYDGRTGELRALYLTPFLDENLVKEDFTGPGPILAWYVRDGLGSVRQLVVGDTVQNSYTYTAWGVPLNWRERVSNRYTFTSREYNPETRNYHHRFRHYIPILGRFIERELNLRLQSDYVYVDSNPCLFRDPWGLWKIRFKFFTRRLCMNPKEVVCSVLMIPERGDRTMLIPALMLGGIQQDQPLTIWLQRLRARRIEVAVSCCELCCWLLPSVKGRIKFIRQVLTSISEVITTWTEAPLSYGRWIVEHNISPEAYANRAYMNVLRKFLPGPSKLRQVGGMVPRGKFIPDVEEALDPQNVTVAAWVLPSALKYNPVLIAAAIKHEWQHIEDHLARGIKGRLYNPMRDRFADPAAEPDSEQGRYRQAINRAVFVLATERAAYLRELNYLSNFLRRAREACLVFNTEICAEVSLIRKHFVRKVLEESVRIAPTLLPRFVGRW